MLLDERHFEFLGYVRLDVRRMDAQYEWFVLGVAVKEIGEGDVHYLRVEKLDTGDYDVSSENRAVVYSETNLPEEIKTKFTLLSLMPEGHHEKLVGSKLWGTVCYIEYFGEW